MYPRGRKNYVDENGRSLAMINVGQRLYDAAGQPHGDTPEGRDRWMAEHREAILTECRAMAEGRERVAERVQRPL